MHLFDGYTKQLAYFDEEITTLRSDGDTLFMRRFGAPKLKYVYNTFVNEQSFAGSDWISKNGYSYADIGAFTYVVNGTNENMQSQNYHLLAPTTTFRFQNFTNTIYLGFTMGISKAHAGECFDTITPFNTINMPSGNVLEIEFDKNDDLWVAFGDEDDNHFALGKLTGNEWSEIYDVNNSPINFSSFQGFEFDTLGNLWVASGNELHTLLTPDSPSWLSTKEWSKDGASIVVYPNPARDFITVNLTAHKAEEVRIVDLQGREVIYVAELTSGEQISIEKLPKGTYIIALLQNNQMIRSRFIKQ
ncbi:MAG: T9SS type A sorting domain-containing protein [Brumimicrobium sp.]|nr:T9SS type A sorting domain-containing protein [Brumimicrobium sp.]